jgi:hypothetical protein
VKKERKNKARSGTELVAMDATAATLLPTKQRDSLIAWFELYMGTQVSARPGRGLAVPKTVSKIRFLGF